MKILRVSQSIYPEKIGGVGLHVHEMSRMQADMGHEVTVLVSDYGDRSKPRREMRNGYEVIFHREIIRPAGYSITPGIVRSLRQKVETSDVLHIHSHLYFSSLIAGIGGRITDIPTVVTNHGLTSQTAPKWLQQAYRPIARFVFESADTIFCYHEEDREGLQEKYSISTPIRVIHNGIDCEMFRPLETNGSRDRPYILFVGRLQSYKGTDTLIKAFDKVADVQPDVDLVIVGDGDEREDFEHMVNERGISERVDFLGMVDNELLPELYSGAEVFVLPSKTEGLPRTVLESIACGTPVVVSDLPQLQQVVGESGHLVPPNDVEALLSAVSKYLSGKNKTCRKARQRVESQYSWEETVNQTTDATNELI